jgi:hypothetical protein
LRQSSGNSSRCLSQHDQAKGFAQSAAGVDRICKMIRYSTPNLQQKLASEGGGILLALHADINCSKGKSRWIGSSFANIQHIK